MHAMTQNFFSTACIKMYMSQNLLKEIDRIAGQAIDEI
jgi:hypothetical protein